MSLKTRKPETEGDQGMPRAKPARVARRQSRPGLSLLAQGEPMIWLTGGALALSALMITALLGMILVSGLRTFWPSSLVRVELRDGTVYLGEVTRTEDYSLSPDMIDGESEPIAAAARELLAGQRQAIVHRQLFRTGNFDLTGTHYHWISDYAVADGKRTEPAWAVLIERNEWGRFYGEPREFAIRNHRELPSAEQELRAIVQFFNANRFRLTPEQTELLDQQLPLLEAKLQLMQWRNVQIFREQFLPVGDLRLDARLDDGRVAPLAETSDDDNILEIHEVLAGPDLAWEGFQQHHQAIRNEFFRRRQLEKHDLGEVNDKIEAARLAVRGAELQHGVLLLSHVGEMSTLQTTLQDLEQAAADQQQTLRNLPRLIGADSPLIPLAQELTSIVQAEIETQASEPKARLATLRDELARTPPAAQQVVEQYFAARRLAEQDAVKIHSEIESIRRDNERYELRMQTAQQVPKALALGEIVRAIPANQLDLRGRLGVYFSRWWEFLASDPREANSEGGVFPAIWGTVVMTLVMSLAVAPFGVLAALYLREYAQAGLLVSAVRISINNLAGVPSIVFGVFGLGFFCYIFGAFLDGGAENAGFEPLPGAGWYALLAVVAVVGVAAFCLGMFGASSSVVGAVRSKLWLRRCSLLLWFACTILLTVLIVRSPFFDGFYATSLPNPTFGKGGLIWASLTLALLTLPVVIVATEEALAAVPNSMREGSYGCGASKWQTIRRITLPHAMPGIMTGMILAMARGAGEVAPLMLVGAVKVAHELPVDTHFPFIHAERSFMHLGFLVYDLGFQSQNSEAAKPMVFTTTLLLIALIALLNLTAVSLRSRLRRRFSSNEF